MLIAIMMIMEIELLKGSLFTPRLSSHSSALLPVAEMKLKQSSFISHRSLQYLENFKVPEE